MDEEEEDEIIREDAGGIIDQDIEMEEGEMEDILTEGEQLLARMEPRKITKGDDYKLKWPYTSRKKEGKHAQEEAIRTGQIKPKNGRGTGIQHVPKSLKQQAAHQRMMNKREKKERNKEMVQRDSGWTGKLGGGGQPSGVKSKDRVKVKKNRTSKKAR